MFCYEDAVFFCPFTGSTSPNWQFNTAVILVRNSFLRLSVCVELCWIYLLFWSIIPFTSKIFPFLSVSLYLITPLKNWQSWNLKWVRAESPARNFADGVHNFSLFRWSWNRLIRLVQVLPTPRTSTSCMLCDSPPEICHLTGYCFWLPSFSEPFLQKRNKPKSVYEFQKIHETF